MAPLSTEVFFYGLFMDPAVLETRGITDPRSRPGILRDWSLCIGHRATLVPDPGHYVHGALVSLSLHTLDSLYAEPSVLMYRPVAVGVETEGEVVPALAYVLPEPPAPEERNPEYAAKLRALAERLGFPEEYTNSIR